MSLLRRLKSRLAAPSERTIPMIDVAVDLGLKVSETSSAHAGQMVRAFRAEGHALIAGEPQRMLREVVFLQVHLVDRFASALLEERPADLFLRTLVPLTFEMHLRSQHPEMAEEESEDEVQRVLLPAFDRVNGEYAGRTLNVQGGDMAGLKDSLIGHFGSRIGTASGIRGGVLPLMTTMPLVPVALKELAIQERLAALSTVARR